jgi:hypothetical protein
VSAYNINPSNGNLSPIVGEPFPAGTGPHGVAVAPQQQ